jgi:LysM repeat protein
MEIAKSNSIRNNVHQIHTVQAGDSPYTIASKYSVHLRELLLLNKIEASSLIRPGQSIRIPFKINSIIGLNG